MKITVSSTSMMKPFLYSEKHSHSPLTHPQRMLGLLELTSFLSTDNDVVVYDRPTFSSSRPMTQQWQNFLHIPDNRGQQCATVFGFKFDGDQTWYQLWNVNTAKTYWLLHDEGMDYQPYAIIAMDALVTLVPNWNGELFMNLSTARGENGINPRQYKLPTTATNRSYDLHISDAATTESGQLWFLVTIKGNQQRRKSEALINTGWIASNAQMACVA